MSDSTTEIQAKMAELIRSPKQPARPLSPIEQEALAFDLEQRHRLAMARVECGSGVVLTTCVDELETPKPKKSKKKKKRKKRKPVAAPEVDTQEDKPLTAKQQELATKVEKLKAKQDEQGTGGK